mmetsp:Transcript_120448/g.209699  ORF Transcript_120448/g.209699 Transcript_120448/m.209699 type:complete len:223 (-) Transcript_120448:780-1448(-)
MNKFTGKPVYPCVCCKRRCLGQGWWGRLPCTTIRSPSIQVVECIDRIQAPACSSTTGWCYRCFDQFVASGSSFRQLRSGFRFGAGIPNLYQKWCRYVHCRRQAHSWMSFPTPSWLIITTHQVPRKWERTLKIGQQPAPRDNKKQVSVRFNESTLPFLLQSLSSTQPCLLTFLHTVIPGRYNCRLLGPRGWCNSRYCQPMLESRRLAGQGTGYFLEHVPGGKT